MRRGLERGETCGRSSDGLGWYRIHTFNRMRPECSLLTTQTVVSIIGLMAATVTAGVDKLTPPKLRLRPQVPCDCIDTVLLCSVTAERLGQLRLLVSYGNTVYGRGFLP